MYTVDELKDLCTQVRRDIIRMTNGASSGHPGGSLGCTEYMVALYTDIMEYSVPFSMDGANEDLFFLSNGHISPVWYSVLARNNFFPVSELATFRKINTRLQGHPTTHEGLPGVRVASGSLGQGMSVAIGAALTKKQHQDTRWVFSLHGDGELQEGQIWEAALFAAHHKIDNLIATIDYNRQQIDGPTAEVMDLGNIEDKFNAFGWTVLHIQEGNNIESVLNGLKEAKKRSFQGKPICILLHTEMGYGVDFMVGTHEWHGKAPNEEETREALAQLPETVGDY